MVKNLPPSGKNTDLTPDQGIKIPHVKEQLSPSATTTELSGLNWRVFVLTGNSHTTQQRPEYHS